MRLYTIGFTRTCARTFFETLRASGARRVLDVRLSNTSQLSGFAKKDDLAYFLEAICGVGYEHRLDLAPTRAMLEAYRRDRDFAAYSDRFTALLRERRVAETLPAQLLEDACLLCSEPSPDECHRRLVAEHLRDARPGIEIVHLRA